MAKEKTPSPLPDDSKRRGLEFFHQSELKLFHRVFAVGNECGLYDAICYCREYEATLPKWALDVIRIRQNELMFGGKNLNKRHDAWRRRFEDDMADRMRFETVEQCLDHGVQQKVVFDVASRALAGTLGEGKPSTMREAYRRFVKRQKENPLRYYIPRYLHVASRHDYPKAAPGGGTMFQFRNDKRFSRRKPVDSAFGVRQLCPPWDPSLLK
jgi:hypothetical protein